MSTISGSLRELGGRAWLMVVISPFRTILPSLVFGISRPSLISLHAALHFFDHLFDVS